MSIMIQKRLFNVEEYYKMGEVGILAENDRTELINGEIIIKMSPINRPHAYIIDVLMEILVIDLRFRAHVSVQSPIYLSEYSMPQPDLYIAKYQKDKYRNGHPTAEDILLIVEVSDSTLKFDQTVKQKLYAKAGIPEYWIINISEEQLEVYKAPIGDEYATKEVIKKGEELVLKILDYDFDLAVLFS